MWASLPFTRISQELCLSPVAMGMFGMKAPRKTVGERKELNYFESWCKTQVLPPNRQTMSISNSKLLDKTSLRQGIEPKLCDLQAELQEKTWGMASLPGRNRESIGLTWLKRNSTNHQLQCSFTATFEVEKNFSDFFCLYSYSVGKEAMNPNDV